MQKKIELVVLLLLIAGLSVLNKNLEKQVTSDKITVKENIVVLDAGHGGADPGKVGIGDILEKDINLQIAKKVKKLLEKEKIQVIMTREEDTMLTGEDSTSTKAIDMKERVNLINETAPKLAVSIHQNSYQDSDVWGAQVFYYENSPEGEKAAQIMQNALLSCDENNTRQAKANDTYYLLKRTEIPTIIVECGFLTNPREAEKLCDDTYQQTLAEAICKGILEYLGKK
ncbi:MAG: N-acetylmuramoyl-L-alanine amidase [Lachnospiraceae bacterium]